MRLVIIGGGAGGMSAAAHARRADPALEITVLEQTEDVSFGLCGLPYFVADVVHDIRALVTYPPEYFRTERRIDVRTLHRAEAIQSGARMVAGRDLRTGEPFELKYDRLILGTGATPRLLGVPGEQLPHVFTLRTLADGVRLKAFLAQRTARRAVIVGGGYIGLELAEALAHWSLPATVLEAGERLLPSFDPTFAAFAEAELARYSIQCRYGQAVTAIEPGAVQTTGGPVPADLVIVAVGNRPEAGLLRQTGVELGRSGALAVGRQMQTSLPSVWAAGDCAESKSAVTGRPFHLPLGSVANLHGRIAGEAAAGRRAESQPLAGTQLLQLFGLALARTGLTEQEARAAGFAPVAAEVGGKVAAHIFADGGEFRVKLVADGRTGRLLGAQIAGHRDGARRIDVVAALLAKGGSIADAAGLDLGYTPPLGVARDPLVLAAQRLAGEIGRRSY